MQILNKILDYIKERPEVRTAIFILSVILSGILSSSFVTEITVEGKLVWSIFYKTTSFWLLCIYTFLLYLYNKFLYQHEKNILNFLDDNYCKAYIRSQCLPEIIEKYKKDLRENKDVSELIDIRIELKKLTGK